MTITLGDIGERIDLRIRQGATFGPHRFTMKNSDNTPFDLTGCTIRGQIRKEPGSPTAALSLACTIIDAPTGIYELEIADTATMALRAGLTMEAPESRYYWDLELLDTGGRVTPLYYGDVQVFREVTR